MDKCQTYTVVLDGGSPWGFSISGGVDFRSPLRVGKVTPGGRASKAGLVGGDYILTINGEDTKDLKHIQAQQIIKGSGNTVNMVCTKACPGVISPATNVNPSFSFPKIQNVSPSRGPVIRAQPISRPKPPPVPSHARSASMDTPSECATAQSSSPHSNVEVYDVKFQGIEVISNQKNDDHNTDLTRNDQSQSLMNDRANLVREPGQSKDVKRFSKESLAAAINKAASERVRRESSGEYCGSMVEEQATVQMCTEQQLNYEFEPDVFLQSNTTVDESDQGQKSPPLSDNPMSYCEDEKVKEEVTQIQHTQQPANYQFDFLTSNGPNTDVNITTEPQRKYQLGAPIQINSNSNQKHVLPIPSMHQKSVSEPVPNVKMACMPSGMVRREPGWYQQLFQQFQNTVEESPGASYAGKKDDDPVYVYDHRGLKVRRDSLTRKMPNIEDQDKQNVRSKSPDEEPVYMYDDRGLRVRCKSAGRARSASTSAGNNTYSGYVSAAKPPIFGQLMKNNRPRSASVVTNNKIGDKKEYKVHQQREEQKPSVQEYIQPQHYRSYSGGTDYSNMSHMHPLLRHASEETSTAPSDMSAEDQPKLNDRTDPNMVQGVLANSSEFEHLEGDSSQPSTEVQTQKEAVVLEEANKKKEKLPPGPKALALFDFDAQSAKEISFKKGAILDLTKAIDDNWLEGSLNEVKGIFPKNYVRVMTLEEYQQTISHEPPKVTKQAITKQARALYNFQGQSEKEISFKKGDILNVGKKIDDNWYEGFLDETQGIFPVVYVEIM